LYKSLLIVSPPGGILHKAKKKFYGTAAVVTVERTQGEGDYGWAATR
jgi:hypothetical protein